MSSRWNLKEFGWELYDEEFTDEEQWDQQSDGEQWDDQSMDGEQRNEQSMDEDPCDEESMDWCEEPADDEEDEQPLDAEWAGEMLDQEMSMPEQWIGELSDAEEWDNEPIEGEEMIIEYLVDSCDCPACIAQASSGKSSDAHVIDCALIPS